MNNETGLLEKLLHTPVRQLSYQTPLCLSIDTSLKKTISHMKDDNRDAVIVLDEDRLVGIFTERDVMLRLDHRNLDWHTVLLGTVMTKDPASISSRANVGTALQLMREGPFRHLPMTKDNGEVLAVLSIRSIISFIADCFPDEFINLPPSPRLVDSNRPPFISS